MVRKFSLLIIFAVFAGSTALSVAQNSGFFKGKLITEALPDGRNLKLVQPLTYIDGNGKSWLAPKGSKTDGASVPRIAWTLFPSIFWKIPYSSCYS